MTGLVEVRSQSVDQQAIQTKLAEFLSQYQDVTDSKGRPLVVRNGYLTQSEIMTGIGPVIIKAPKTRACVSRTTILTMVYKLGLSAEKGWRKLRGFRRLADVINDIKFIDGVDEETFERQRNAA